MTTTTRPARIALVGDHSPSVRSHQRVPGLLAALRERHGLPVDGYWIASQDAELPGAVDRFDAVWLLPGSPYRSEAGALAAVRTAREQGIPFLATCGGFQHALLEFARDVCGLTGARHTENEAEGATGAEDDVLIAPLACSLVGHEGRLSTVPGSLAERLLGSRETVERFHCSYGPVAGLLPLLEAGGLRFTAHDTEGSPESPNFPATRSSSAPSSSRNWPVTAVCRTPISGRWPKPLSPGRPTRRAAWIRPTPAGNRRLTKNHPPGLFTADPQGKVFAPHHCDHRGHMSRSSGEVRS